MRTLLSVSNFPYATPTVTFGGQVASALQSEVTLLTVRPPAEAQAVGDDVLSQAAKLLPVAPSALRLSRGSPQVEILAELKRGQYDLIVLGARDHPTPGELLLGYVARRVVKQSGTSVLVIRQPNLQLKNILVCTSGPETAEPTVPLGTKLAQAADAKITLLHVTAAVPSMYTGLPRLGQSLSELLQTDTPIAKHLKECAGLIESHSVDAQIELRHGVPGEEILRAAELSDFDLLVVGSSGQRRLNRLLLDEVSLQIVAHAPRPVLVVRGSYEVVEKDK